MRLVAYGGVSTLSATCAVLAAFRQRANFYAAAVYLSKSNACMMILCNFGIFCTIILAKILQSIFFGQLRLAEIERVNDRLWFTISETLLALAMFRDEFDTSFVVLFISLIFVKCFHWLAAYRVEWMDQTTSPPGRLFHARMISVLSIIWVTDMLLIAYATESVLLHGPSVVLMFEMEYIIMQVTCLSIICKYILNSYAHYRAQEHWEGKSTYQFYIDLATDFLKLLTYIGFLSLTLTFHGLPINVLRDVYYTFRSFITKCNNLVRFRQATRNMNERYPNATRAEMESLTDKTCIICREDMEFRDDHEPQAGDPAPNNNNNGTAPAGPNDTPKKLVCGHIFHFHCLRSWLERQQTCPTCRRPVIQAPPATQVAPQNPNAAVNRAFAAAMAAAGAGPPPIPPANPAAARGQAPGAPLGLPAAQPGQPPHAGAGDPTLIGTRPDGTRQDFHQRMREFEQRFAAATTPNPGGPNSAAPGSITQLRQQAQTRNNPLLQFDLSAHPTPSPSRPIAGPHHLRLRTNPGSRTSSNGFPTFPSSRTSVERKNSQTSTDQPQAGATSKDQASSSAKPATSLLVTPRPQSDAPKDTVETALPACPEDTSTPGDSHNAQQQSTTISSTTSTEQSSDKELTSPKSLDSERIAPGLVQPASLAEMRIDFGGLKEQKPQLPCLIPLFDHHQRPSFVPASSSSSSSTFTNQALLQEYQQKIIEFGGKGHSASFVGEAGGAIQDPKTAQLLEIQNSLADCCAKLARFMAPDSAQLPAVNPAGSLDGRPRSSSQLNEISKDDGNVSGSQGAEDEVQVDQVGKGKGKSDGQ
ncbi:uncharacterized protein PGTG_02563 [Puccinia graminis f. sp. tritici CRL 75-36-700-3]|uniref:RING-type E3 ubiquitin transferase n=1 Tax=Puccinia graminis f. sp. tritici (strain CRL 75-36-700-3 / race SCCL) TaxID=418459 RepID=E3JVP7_PUCGT|nr:uncharacterized protein PGTG_02563 [Puccinia graminis f. sp. tritici CRL 75-36-700-3]EFP76122.2 hypothetical protein PGTG_02563 [Puccinia graminis f. sp. tritici CRL 75-36-700-3]